MEIRTNLDSSKMQPNMLRQSPMYLRHSLTRCQHNLIKFNNSMLLSRFKTWGYRQSLFKFRTSKNKIKIKMITKIRDQTNRMIEFH